MKIDNQPLEEKAQLEKMVTSGQFLSGIKNSKVRILNSLKDLAARLNISCRQSLSPPLFRLRNCRRVYHRG